MEMKYIILSVIVGLIAGAVLYYVLGTIGLNKAKQKAEQIEKEAQDKKTLNRRPRSVKLT